MTLFTLKVLFAVLTAAAMIAAGIHGKQNDSEAVEFPDDIIFA